MEFKKYEQKQTDAVAAQQVAPRPPTMQSERESEYVYGATAVRTWPDGRQWAASQPLSLRGVDAWQTPPVCTNWRGAEPASQHRADFRR